MIRLLLCLFLLSCGQSEPPPPRLPYCSEVCEFPPTCTEEDGCVCVLYNGNKTHCVPDPVDGGL